MKVVYLIGRNTFSLPDGEYPFFLTEVNHETVLEFLIRKTDQLDGVSSVFCIYGDLIRKFNLKYLIRELLPDPQIVPVNGETQGSLCTAMLSCQHIDNEDEVLLLAIDDFVDVSYREIVDYFRQGNFDAGVVSFRSVHPRYSYVRLGENAEPVEFCEKKPISRNALASFYYFKHGRDFMEAAKDVIRKDSPLNGRFYISMAFNELILKQKSIGVFQIPSSSFHPLKSEIEMASYIAKYQGGEGV